MKKTFWPLFQRQIRVQEKSRLVHIIAVNLLQCDGMKVGGGGGFIVKLIKVPIAKLVFASCCGYILFFYAPNVYQLLSQNCIKFTSLYLFLTLLGCTNFAQNQQGSVLLAKFYSSTLNSISKSSWLQGKTTTTDRKIFLLKTCFTHTWGEFWGFEVN